MGVHFDQRLVELLEDNGLNQAGGPVGSETLTISSPFRKCPMVSGELHITTEQRTAFGASQCPFLEEHQAQQAGGAAPVELGSPRSSSQAGAVFK